MEHLLRVLEERDINLGADDVAWAFESSKSRHALTSWINEYLTPATLLTREELTFHENKAGNTSVETTWPGSYIDDESLEVAIAALETSTASVEKQCLLLEGQKRAIEGIIRRNVTKSNDKDGKVQYHASTHERAQLEFEREALSDSLQSRFGGKNKQLHDLIDTAPSTIQRFLEKDDRLLGDLEKVIPQLLVSTDAVEAQDELDRLCNALASQSSLDIRSRLDNVYRTSTAQAEAQINGNHRDTRDTLRSELEELCREIDGLSVMAINSEYRTPISRILQVAHEDAEVGRAAWSSYVTSTLKQLTERMDIINDHYQHLHAHSDAIKSISTSFESVSKSSSAEKTLAYRESDNTSHANTTVLQKGLKPLRLVQANLSENQDPVSLLLKSVDVRTVDSARLPEVLYSAVKNHKEQLQSLTSTSQRSLSDQIALSLSRTDTHTQALLGPVLAASEFGSLELSDSGVTEGVDELEETTRFVGQEMRGLDLDGIGSLLGEKQKAVVEMPKAKASY